MNSVVANTGLAARNLRRNTRRTTVAILTVAFGIVAYVLASGFIAWIFQEIREATIHSQTGHLQIVRPGYYEKGIADPYAFLLPEQSSERETLEHTPGFSTLAPRLAFNGLISHGDTTIPFLGEGVAPVPEEQLSSRMEIVRGANLQSSSEPSTILGEGLARSLGVKAGGRVVLLVTTASGGTNAVEVTVSGIFATMYKDYDDTALRLPIDVTRKLMRVDGATSWLIVLRDTAQTVDAVKYLESRLDRKHWEIIPWTSLADFYNKTVALFSKQLTVVKFIIAIIIILTISNTQMMSVLERTTEIGTSMAIGLRGGDILRLFLTEGVLIGLSGGMAGVALGYTLAWGISAIGIPMPPPPGMAHGYSGRILINSTLVFDALTLAFTTTLAASAFPAWRASRMNIVDALRCNQ